MALYVLEAHSTTAPTRFAQFLSHLLNTFVKGAGKNGPQYLRVLGGRKGRSIRYASKKVQQEGKPQKNLNGTRPVSPQGDCDAISVNGSATSHFMLLDVTF